MPSQTQPMSQKGTSTNVQPAGGVSVGSATIRFTTTLSELTTAQFAIFFLACVLDHIFILTHGPYSGDRAVEQIN